MRPPFRAPYQAGEQTMLIDPRGANYNARQPDDGQLAAAWVRARSLEELDSGAAPRPPVKNASPFRALRGGR